MKRVGYDADSGKYFFRDDEGRLWEGEEGAQIGEMTRVLDDATATHNDEDDVENGPRRRDGYALLSGDVDGGPHQWHSGGGPYRMLFPFFLTVIVVLLLVWRLIVSPGLTHVKCPEGSSRVTVVAGDTCWKIAEAHGCGLEALRSVNSNLACERLLPGDKICVPSAAAPERDVS